MKSIAHCTVPFRRFFVSGIFCVRFDLSISAICLFSAVYQFRWSNCFGCRFSGRWCANGSLVSQTHTHRIPPNTLLLLLLKGSAASPLRAHCNFDSFHFHSGNAFAFWKTRKREEETEILMRWSALHRYNWNKLKRKKCRSGNSTGPASRPRQTATWRHTQNNYANFICSMQHAFYHPQTIDYDRFLFLISLSRCCSFSCASFLIVQSKNAENRICAHRKLWLSGGECARAFCLVLFVAIARWPGHNGDTYISFVCLHHHNGLRARVDVADFSVDYFMGSMAYK